MLFVFVCVCVCVCVHLCTGVARNWSWGVQIYIFTSRFLFILRLCMKSLKIQFYLVLSDLGLGVQMPHCTPLGYATAFVGGCECV
jgi:hypothetical protein